MGFFDLIKGKKAEPEEKSEKPAKDKPLILDQDLFNKFRNLIYDRHGVFITDNRLKEFERKAALRIMANSYHSFDHYYKILGEEGNFDELVAIVKDFTGEQKIFFNPEKLYRAIVSILIPDIIKNKDANSIKISVINAGDCREAYTFAILYHVYIKQFLPDFKIEIFAVEKDHELKTKAVAAKYDFKDIKELPDSMKEKFFKKNEDNQYELSDVIKSTVNIIHVNSYFVFPAELNRSDIIFCRDYISSLNKTERKEFINQIENLLSPESYFIVGDNETLHGLSHNLKVIHLPKNLIYKK